MGSQNVATVNAIKEYVRKNATPLWQADLPYAQYDIVFASDGNIYSCILANNAAGDDPKDPTLEENQDLYWIIASGSGGATTIEGVAGEAIVQHELVALAADGKYYRAQNDDSVLCQVAGFATDAAILDAAVVIQKIGPLEDEYTLRGDIVVGEELYLGKDGAVLRPSDTLNADEYRVLVGTMNPSNILDVFLTEPIRNAADTVATNIPVGSQVIMSVDNYIPESYLLADGSAISRSVYSTLNAIYSAEGYPYGAGDGSTTFNLPDWSSTDSLPVLIKVRNGGPTDPTEEAQLESRVSVLENSDGKEVGEVFFTSIFTELPGCKWTNYQTLSKLMYSELFSRVGHSYAKSASDAQTADLEGKFHIPDGQFLFARGGSSWLITEASINSSTDYGITIPSHGFATDGSDDGRAIKLQRVPGQNPTLPEATNYAEYDQNYIRVLDADTIALYPTEAEAIDTSGVVNRIEWTSVGSGTFLITTMGCYQSSAMRRHYHEFWGNHSGGGAGTTDNNFYGGGAIYSDSDWIRDPTDVDRSDLSDELSDNETRPSYVSFGMQIKVIGVSSSGAFYDSIAYEYSWTQQADFTITTVPISHNLNTDLSNLIVEIYVSSDGTEDNAFKPSTGFRIEQDSTSQISIYFDGTNTDIVDGAYLKVVVYKPVFTSATKVLSSSQVTEDTTIEISPDDYDKQYFINSSVGVTPITLTVNPGIGAGEENSIWIKNNSTVVQTVTNGGTDFWLEAGQKTKFIWDGSALVWASAGWELVFNEESNVGANVPESSLLRTVQNGDIFKCRSLNGAIHWIGQIEVHDRTVDNYGPTIADSAQRSFLWDASATALLNNGGASVPIKEIKLWHGAA